MLNGCPTPKRRPASLNLLRFSIATRAYLSCCRDILPDVVSLGEDGAFLRELIDAGLKATEWGSPAAIGMATAELTGEA